jgi:hypothetical protein
MPGYLSPAYNLPIAAAEAAEAAEAARCAEAAGLEAAEAAELGGEVAEVVEAVESAASGAGGAAFGFGAFVDIARVTPAGLDPTDHALFSALRECLVNKRDCSVVPADLERTQDGGRTCGRR